MKDLFNQLFDDTRKELQPGYYEIFEADLETEDESTDSKVVIIRGGLRNENPVELLARVSSEYKGDEYRQYNDFVEISLTNMWVHVLIKNLNNLKFENFDSEKHRL